MNAAGLWACGVFSILPGSLYPDSLFFPDGSEGIGGVADATFLAVEQDVDLGVVSTTIVRSGDQPAILTNTYDDDFGEIDVELATDLHHELAREILIVETGDLEECVLDREGGLVVLACLLGLDFGMVVGSQSLEALEMPLGILSCILTDAVEPPEVFVELSLCGVSLVPSLPARAQCVEVDLRKKGVEVIGPFGHGIDWLILRLKRTSGLLGLFAI